jgi:hypothetical protein
MLSRSGDGGQELLQFALQAHFILMDRNHLLLQRRTKPLVLRGIEWEEVGHLDADRGEFPPDIAEPAPVVATVGYSPR